MASVDQYRRKYIRKNGQCAFYEIYVFHTSKVRKLSFIELEFLVQQQTTQEQTSSTSMSIIINWLLAVAKQQLYWSTCHVMRHLKTDSCYKNLLFKEEITVYFDNHMKPLNTICGKMQGF
jgi:hypothetical protein